MAAYNILLAPVIIRNVPCAESLLRRIISARAANLIPATPAARNCPVTEYKSEAEAEILQNIIKAFATRSDCRLLRQNTGAVKINGRFVRFGTPGRGDLVLFARQLYAEIEVKTATGRQSKQQKAYEKMITGYGHTYLLARSVEDVKNYFCCPICDTVGYHLCEKDA